MTSSRIAAALGGLALLSAFVPGAARAEGASAAVDVERWKRGLKLMPASHPELLLWFWWYEWNLFDALNPGDISGAVATPGRRLADGAWRLATPWVPGVELFARSEPDGVALRLEVTNETRRDWDELASVVPCLGARYRHQTTENFDTLDSYFHGPEGLELVYDRDSWRAMHFNGALRRLLDARRSRRRNGEFAWDGRWPRSERDAARGLILRESHDDRWVMGVAWERFLAAQGHNPMRCLHLSVRLGPLARGETRSIRGKLYLMRGNRDTLLARYREEFGG